MKIVLIVISLLLTGILAITFVVNASEFFKTHDLNYVLVTIDHPTIVQTDTVAPFDKPSPLTSKREEIHGKTRSDQ